MALLAAAIHAYESAAPGNAARDAGGGGARGWALKGRLDGLR